MKQKYELKKMLWIHFKLSNSSGNFFVKWRPFDIRHSIWLCWTDDDDKWILLIGHFSKWSKIGFANSVSKVSLEHDGANGIEKREIELRRNREAYLLHSNTVAVDNSSYFRRTKHFCNLQFFTIFRIGSA